MKMVFNKKGFFKEAKAETLSYMPKEMALIYKFVNFSGTAFSFSLIFFLISLVGLFMDSTRYIAGISAISFFVAFCLFCLMFFFMQPYPYFYIDTIADIKKNVKKLERQELEKSAGLAFSDAMRYWDLSHAFKYEKNSVYLDYLDKFSKSLHVDINSQDIIGNTILHKMLVDDPESPFIAKALLLNADIYITNNEGVSVYALLQQKLPEYLIFVEKNMLTQKIQVAHEANRSVARL